MTPSSRLRRGVLIPENRRSMFLRNGMWVVIIKYKNYKIICDFIHILKQIRVQTSENSEFFLSRTGWIQKCRRGRHVKGAISAVESRSREEMGHQTGLNWTVCFDWGWLQWLSCQCDWPNLDWSGLLGSALPWFGLVWSALLSSCLR